MNKIQVEDITNEERNITIDKDSTIIIKNSKVKLNFDIKTNINIFLLFLDSFLKTIFKIFSSHSEAASIALSNNIPKILANS